MGDDERAESSNIGPRIVAPPSSATPAASTDPVLDDQPGFGASRPYRLIPPSRESLPELLLAAGVTAFGALVVYETTKIRVVPIYAKVGPRIIPYIVGVGLIVLGIWLAVEVLLGRTAKPSEESEDADVSLPTDWVTVGLLAVSLAVYLYLIERAGFIIASSLLFYGAAFAMGSRRYLRDAAVAIILSVVVFYIFTAGLDLRLPHGLLG
jgi:putative tricarboxylic transport membrane protein